MADEGLEGGTEERGDGWHMRMGPCNMRGNSRAVGEERRSRAGPVSGTRLGEAVQLRYRLGLTAKLGGFKQL